MCNIKKTTHLNKKGISIKKRYQMGTYRPIILPCLFPCGGNSWGAGAPGSPAGGPGPHGGGLQVLAKNQTIHSLGAESANTEETSHHKGIGRAI